MSERSADLLVPVHRAPLGASATGWFTGRGSRGRVSEDRPGHPSNLSHRRPHRPVDLARARDAVGRATGTQPWAWHLMHQVHGAEVGVVDDATLPGTEHRGVDALVSAVPGRVLCVSVADCVPVLLAGAGAVGAVHAGRAGVLAGVVDAAVAALARLGAPADTLHAAIGPAIGGCCYEVPSDLRDQVAAGTSVAATTTTWGTPSLDLPAAVRAQLTELGVHRIESVGGCTRCDPTSRWFSHRTDPTTGRQFGMVVARPGSERGTAAEGRP